MRCNRLIINIFTLLTLQRKSVCVLQQNRPAVEQRQSGVVNVPVSASSLIDYNIEIIAFPGIIPEPEICYQIVFRAVILQKCADRQLRRGHDQRLESGHTSGKRLAAFLEIQKIVVIGQSQLQC